MTTRPWTEEQLDTPGVAKAAFEETYLRLMQAEDTICQLREQLAAAEFRASAHGSRPDLRPKNSSLRRAARSAQAPLNIKGVCTTWDAQERDLAGQGLVSIGHVMLGAMLRGFDHRYVRVRIETIELPAGAVPTDAEYE